MSLPTNEQLTPYALRLKALPLCILHGAKGKAAVDVLVDDALSLTLRRYELRWLEKMGGTAA